MVSRRRPTSRTAAIPENDARGARGYSWAPFEDGNQAALKHGAYVPARTDPIAHRFISEVLQDPSVAYLTHARFASALWSWAIAEARVEILTTWVDEMPFDQSAKSNRGQTSPLELLRKWMATAQTLSARLGLDPLSSARLGKDYAQGTLADAATELTRLRAQHEAASH